MRLIGNICWLLLGGLAIALAWALVGIVLCLTVVGIPLGVQAFKMARLTLTPFGRQVIYGGGLGSWLANLLWIILGGWWLALAYLAAGLVTMLTVVGIPFGLQAFKMARLALMPFGSSVRVAVL